MPGHATVHAVKYYVLMDGEYPTCIRFTLDQAIAMSPSYIDGFSEIGEHVTSWKLVNGGYTTDF